MRTLRLCARYIVRATLAGGAAACSQASVPMPAAPAIGVQLRRDIATYDVAGTTALEIRASILTRARLESDRTPYAGYTRWDLSWKYARSTRTRGGCSPAGVVVNLMLRVRYPAWTDSAAATPELRQEWNRYINALRAHEGNHAAIAIRGASELARDLRKMALPNCAFVTMEGQKLAAAAMRRISSENEKYDQTTAHGATEGASLREPEALQALIAGS